jgi:hypothetical protein
MQTVTKYLNGKPFTEPVSSGKLTTEEYFVRVGALVFCHACNKNVAVSHACPYASPAADQGDAE